MHMHWRCHLGCWWSLCDVNPSSVIRAPWNPTAWDITNKNFLIPWNTTAFHAPRLLHKPMVIWSALHSSGIIIELRSRNYWVQSVHKPSSVTFNSGPATSKEIIRCLPSSQISTGYANVFISLHRISHNYLRVSYVGFRRTTTCEKNSLDYSHYSGRSRYSCINTLLPVGKPKFKHWVRWMMSISDEL